MITSARLHLTCIYLIQCHKSIFSENTRNNARAISEFQQNLTTDEQLISNVKCYVTISIIFHTQTNFLKNWGLIKLNTIKKKKKNTSFFGNRTSLPPSNSHWPAIQNPHTRWPAIQCTVHWHSYVKVTISFKTRHRTAATQPPRVRFTKIDIFLSLRVKIKTRTGIFRGKSAISRASTIPAHAHIGLGYATYFFELGYIFLLN